MITKVRNISHLVTKILFNVMAVLFGLTMIISVVTANSDVAALLTENVFKDKPADVIVNTGKEPARFKTWYSSIADNLNGNGEIGWLAQKEGTTLLKNENNALPLAENEKVSLYGVTAYDPMYCLDGAGNNKINDPQAYNGLSQVNRRQFFYDEFEEAGLEMNESLKNWYNSDDGKYYRRKDFVGFWGNEGGNGEIPALTEANWSEVSADAKAYNNGFGKDTTAVYITGRMTNEMLDLTPDGWGTSKTDANLNNDGTKDKVDYMAFTADEKNLLEELGKNYKKVIVIFNQANPPQENIPKLLNDYGIEAAIWAGFPGSDGIKAVADIITGKANPSGGLSAAWYANRNANPSTQNYAVGGAANVVNVEGMYVGYRYAETRYEDVLRGRENAGDYDYAANISYPFGYGKSYSTFSYSNVEVVKDPDPAKNYYTGGLMAANDKLYHGNYGKKRPAEEQRATGAVGDCDDIIMNVTVTNNGPKAGKEIVQVYLSQPITADDIAHRVEKPAVQLIGYGKTKELDVGDSDVVSIKIDANKWFAAYDSRATGGGGYVLSAGEYLLAAARNSHEAVNSIYRKKGGDVNNADFDDTYGAGSAANVATVTVSDARASSYKYWTQGTTDEVHNLFDDVDPNMDSKADNDVKFFSRYNWTDTAAIQANGRIGEDARNKTGDAYQKTANFDNKGTLDSEKIDAFATYYNITDLDTTEYVYGWSKTEWQLVDLIGVEYDPARGATEEDVRKWSEIVGQMTSADFQRLFSDGLRKTLSISSIGKPGTNDQNASNGFEWAFAVDNKGKVKHADYGFMRKFDAKAQTAYSTGYPCEGIIAASFNNEVALLVGQAMGEDALWGGVSGLYGFGLGLQRNPYHGRAGEFYSDDSFLTGMMGAYETKGAQMKGLYVYNKHFVLNDQDTDRNSYRSWLTEQTMRQIYLRPFEMAIEIGDASNVMIAFNEIGDAWTGSNYNLMTRWLRGEAGMGGFAISDYAPAEGENLGYGIISGANLLDGPSAGYSAGCDPRYDNKLVEAAIKILYTVANSNAMNFLGDDVRIYSFDPPWYKMRDTFVTVMTVLFIVSCVLVVATTAWKLLDKYVFDKKRQAAK